MPLVSTISSVLLPYDILSALASNGASRSTIAERMALIMLICSISNCFYVLVSFVILLDLPFDLAKHLFAISSLHWQLLR